MKVNFHFGKKEPTWKMRIAVALFFASGVPFLARVLRVTEESLIDFIDEVVKRHFPESAFNEYLIKSDKHLSRRVTREVDKAIESYNELTGDNGDVKIESPIYTEKEPDGSEVQSLLGGEMRLTSPWEINSEESNGKQNVS